MRSQDAKSYGYPGSIAVIAMQSRWHTVEEWLSNLQSKLDCYDFLLQSPKCSLYCQALPSLLAEGIQSLPRLPDLRGPHAQISQPVSTATPPMAHSYSGITKAAVHKSLPVPRVDAASLHAFLASRVQNMGCKGQESGYFSHVSQDRG